MRKFLFMIMMTCMATLGFAAESTPRTLVISSVNTVVLRGAVKTQNVNEVKQQLSKISEKLREEEEIYLFLDTPGGSIFAGLELIDYAKALPQKVTTITLRAASMGFVFVQHLDKRYILPSGTLMMHRAKVGIQGQINDGEFETRANHIKQVVTNMELVMAERVGLNISDYRDMVKDEIYTDGKTSLDMNFVDEVVLVRCGKDMYGTYTEKRRTMFGVANLKWSKCPLISYPVAVNFGRNSRFHRESSESQQQILLNLRDGTVSSEGSNIKADWIQGK